jgi:hypothetical protein
MTSHAVVYVQVTSTNPPHFGGAFAGALFDSTPLHPPLAVVDAMNCAYAASSCAWVWHDGSVTFTPQLNVTAGAALTVNVFVHVLVTSQELV